MCPSSCCWPAPLAAGPGSHRGRPDRRPRLRHPVPPARAAEPGARPGHQRLPARGGPAQTAPAEPHRPPSVRALPTRTCRAAGAHTAPARLVDAPDTARGRRPVPLRRHLRLRPRRRPVLDDVSLRLPHGTHLAVVGPSGAGKSTLAGLAAGLLRPRHGTVRLCGERAVGATARAHRVLIPQEAYVFGGSLAENLGELRPKPVPEGSCGRRRRRWASPR
ncbi:ATP-binding cassette domain-containing protein [Streptomyces sp. LBUM 1484]|nr:ATP-binding cassette domain-containing protein [Streptomyces sp. LBUM 1484]